METIKAGCILINQQKNKVGLVFRQNLNDWSFPKGHLEVGETLMQCALRETAEETKRDCKIIFDEPFEEEYCTPAGEKCKCFMYLALDLKQSDNKSLDTHPFEWIAFDEVEDRLTYDNLKTLWKKSKKVLKQLNII